MDTSPARLGAILLRNRRTARAPVWLYRRGLGWLFGTRLLMLEHVGRASEAPRFAVLETIDRPEPDSFMVASGFGRESQWYRNLEAQPGCHVSVGRRRRYPAQARLLSLTESQAVLSRYRLEHPTSWEFLRQVIETDGAQDPSAIPVVELRLSTPE